ncbi:MAG: hypothetical protein L0206_18220, partial [Actinobacteria bacterium]|nr:hypothetical protein [Actinomycetota bacterium]
MVLGAAEEEEAEDANRVRERDTTVAIGVEERGVSGAADAAFTGQRSLVTVEEEREDPDRVGEAEPAILIAVAGDLPASSRLALIDAGRTAVRRARHPGPRIAPREGMGASVADDERAAAAVRLRVPGVREAEIEDRLSLRAAEDDSAAGVAQLAPVLPGDGNASSVTIREKQLHVPDHHDK